MLLSIIFEKLHGRQQTWKIKNLKLEIESLNEVKRAAFTGKQSHCRVRDFLLQPNIKLLSESEQKNEYSINVVKNENGKDKSYIIDINRSTGDLVLSKLPDRPIGLSFKENLALIQDGKMKTVYGSCYEIKR